MNTISINPSDQEILKPIFEQQNIPQPSFVGSVLLSGTSFHPDELAEILASDWGIELPREISENNLLLLKEENHQCLIYPVPSPIPTEEAMQYAQKNSMWENAVEVVRQHQSRILIAVWGNEKLSDQAIFFVKVMASCAKLSDSLAVNYAGILFEPDYYTHYSEMIYEGYFPIYNLVWFGIDYASKGVSGYTDGMRLFGKYELEVLDAYLEPENLYEFLISLASYLIEENVDLKDGDSIGFTPEQQCIVQLSNGVAHSFDTLKIQYQP